MLRIKLTEESSNCDTIKKELHNLRSDMKRLTSMYQNLKVQFVHSVLAQICMVHNLLSEHTSVCILTERTKKCYFHSCSSVVPL